VCVSVPGVSLGSRPNRARSERTADANGAEVRTPTPAGDLLERNFIAEMFDLRWVADITEFGCVDGELFLASIVDLHDRSMCGWSMGEHQVSDLVVNALVMTLARRDPDNGLIHRADHGGRHTSLESSNRLDDWKIQPSHGSVGDCFDNAAMEATWATIKREIRHIHGAWTQLTRSRLRTVLFDYIETFYSRARHQAHLEHRTPTETYAASQAT
jgi:putative transposase